MCPDILRLHVLRNTFHCESFPKLASYALRREEVTARWLQTLRKDPIASTALITGVKPEGASTSSAHHGLSCTAERMFPDSALGPTVERARKKDHRSGQRDTWKQDVSNTSHSLPLFLNPFVPRATVYN